MTSRENDPCISRENKIIREDLESIVASFDGWEFFRGKTILVTGGGGLIASYLARVLLHATDILDLGIRLTCLVRSSPGKSSRLGKWLDHTQLSLAYGMAELFDYSMLKKQDLVVHAASNASPCKYSQDPIGTLLPNTEGTLRLCTQASAWGTERLLFFSSSEVYGDIDKYSITEVDFGSLDPNTIRSCYAESKRMGESICKAYNHQHGLDTVTARIFHTYGPQLALGDGRVFADFVRDAVQGGDIIVAGDGIARRCFCYISDSACAFLTLLTKGASGEAYNVANPYTETSIADLASLISSICQAPRQVKFTSAREAKPGYLPSRALRCLPSINKLSAIGWSPSVGLEDGFRRTIESYSH